MDFDEAQAVLFKRMGAEIQANGETVLTVELTPSVASLVSFQLQLGGMSETDPMRRQAIQIFTETLIQEMRAKGLNATAAAIEFGNEGLAIIHEPPVTH